MGSGGRDEICTTLLSTKVLSTSEVRNMALFMVMVMEMMVA